MSRRRDLVVVLALLALAAAAAFLLLVRESDDDATTAPPPTDSPVSPPSAAPVRGVRADGVSRRPRRPSEVPAADTAPKGPTGSLLVNVRGSVRGRAGLAPLESASVYVIDGSGADWRAVTAAAGSARFDELPAGKTVVHVEVQGRKAFDKNVSLTAGEETSVEVLAFVVGTVRGTVRDPNGLVVDDAWVRAGANDAVTNDDGTFEISGVPTGTDLTLTAGSPEWADAEPVTGLRIDGEPPTVVRDIALRRPGSLVVRLFDPEGRAANGTVHLDGRTPALERTVAGEYAGRRVSPGWHDVVAKLSPYPEARARVLVRDGEQAEVTVRFEEGVAIEGVVVDANGTLVPRATVTTARPARLDTDGPSLRAAHFLRSADSSTRSGEDGTFRLANLVPGDYVLSAGSESFASTSYVTAHAPSSGVRIQVTATSRVKFRIVSDGGEFRSFTVLGCAPSAPPNRAGAGSGWATGGGSTQRQRAVEIGGVLPDVRGLWICGDTFAPTVVPVSLVGGTTSDLGDIRVDAGLSLTGRVVASDGTPVEGAGVSAARSSRQCHSGKDGTFVLEHLAPGPVVVRAVAARLMGVAVLDVARDAPRADLVVRTAGVLKGAVRNADGTAAKGAAVRVRHGFADAADDEGAWQTVKTGGDGRFAHPVTAGRCLASAGGAWVAADVAEGGEATVTLEKP
jgi:hypothetical protein